MIYRITSKEWVSIDKPKSQWGSSITNHVKDYVFELRQIHTKTWETLRYEDPLFSVVYEAKSVEFCTQVPRTCVQKRLVLDFHLFA